jgi:AraC family transcriptional activator of pyochelin receptor
VTGIFMETKQHIEFDYGSRYSTTWEFDGIRMGHAISRFGKCVAFQAKSDQTDMVRLHIGLKGNYSFYQEQMDSSFHLIGGHHNIMYSKDFSMEVQNRTMELETFGVQFPRKMFVQFTQGASEQIQQFSRQIMEEKTAIFSEHWGAVDPSVQEVIYQIINNHYSGDLKKLFLLSKSIELLVLCAESYNLASNNYYPFLKNKADKEKILAVRDLINERVQCPPNLSEIARIVGLNEYKLKKGFKEMFNHTVFGYLIEQRLLLARQYLRDTLKTAHEISSELGYATPQHFNNAFKKRFGITPALIRNNP